MANKVSYIIQLQNRFSREAEKIRSSSVKMERNISRVRIELKKTGQRFTKFQKKLKSSAVEMGKLGAIALATATIPIALLGKSFIEAGSDAVETQNKFNAIFDDVKDKANQVAKSFAKDFGVALSTSQEMLGNTGDLLVGFGLSGDAALDFAKKVAESGADLASFLNLQGGAKRAVEAITKGILGEAEGLKSLNIVIKQNTPEFKRQIKLLQQSTGVTELQAKAQVIFNEITKQSGKSIGDVNRTWDDYASVARRASEKTKELRESFGKLLLPTATKLIKKLISLLESLNNLSPSAKTLILILGGVVAILGPLLFLLAGVAIAVSVINLPMLAWAAAIGLTIFIIIQLLDIGGPLLVLLAGIAIAMFFITGPIFLIVAAIALMVVAGILIVKNWEVIKEGAKALWQGISDFFSRMVDTVIEFGAAVIKFALNPIESIADIISNIGASIKSFFTGEEVKVKVAPIDIPQIAVKVAPIDIPQVPDVKNIARFEGLQAPTQRSRTDINVNLRAPERTVESIKTRTSGTNPGLNVGVNMEAAL